MSQGVVTSKPGIAVVLDDGNTYVLTAVNQGWILRNHRQAFIDVMDSGIQSTAFMLDLVEQSFAANHPQLKDGAAHDLYEFPMLPKLFQIAMDGDYAVLKKLRAEQPGVANPVLDLIGSDITPSLPLAPDTQPISLTS